MSASSAGAKTTKASSVTARWARARSRQACSSSVLRRSSRSRSVNGGNQVAVGTGFNVVVESLDVGDTPAPVTASTGISLGLVGPGALGGDTTCTIGAAANTCTVTGATIDTAQIGALLSANRTSGDVLTGGLSTPFDVIATPPGAPTGITAVQVQGGILVTLHAPGQHRRCADHQLHRDVQSRRRSPVAGPRAPSSLRASPTTRRTRATSARPTPSARAA